MSIYKEKGDFFDAAFKQIAQDYDSDSDGPSRSQEVHENREDATTKPEPLNNHVVDDPVDLDDSIEFLGATGGRDDGVHLEVQKIDIQPEKRLEEVLKVDDVVIEDQSPELEQLTTGACRRSSRLRSRKKNKTPPKTSAKNKNKTPPKMAARNKHKTPPKKQQHVIDVTISDDDEPMIVHFTNNEPQDVVRTPTPRADMRTRKSNNSRNNDSIHLGQTSFEDYSYNLKLMRFGVMEQYETTWYTKLSIALKDLVSHCKTSGKVLVLTKRNEYEPLPLDGTPHSLGLDSGTILNAIAVLPHQQPTPQKSNPRVAQPTSKPKARDPNVIHLKLQDGQRKHTKEYSINLREPIGKLRKAYADEFGHKLEDMKLLNEGDACSDSDTPLDLELEDGYMLDVVVAH